MGNLLAEKAQWALIIFDTPHHIVRSIFSMIALAILIGYLIAYLILREKPIWQITKRNLILGIVVYAVIVFVTELAFTLLEDGLLPILFVPILITVLIVGGSVVALILKPGRTTNLVTGVLIGVGILAVLICIGVHYASGNAVDFNGVDEKDVNSLMLYLFAAIGIALIFFISYFFGRKGNDGFSTRSIAYAAISIALSFALSFLTLFKMPQGGSVTLVSLLPLMLYSQMFGVRKGVVVGFIYGLLQAIQSPWILHPAQFLLDYPIAFAMIGFVSIFTQGGIMGKRGIVFFALGAIFAVTLRYLTHFVSGVFAFSSYAGYYGYTSGVVYSLAYNSFAFIDMAIALVVGVLMLMNSAFLKQVNSITLGAMNKQTPAVVNDSSEDTNPLVETKQSDFEK